MKLTLYLINSLLALVLLAACIAPQPASTVPNSTTNQATSDQPAGDNTAFPVTITHDRGEVTLAKPAERIIVFSEEFIELFIALDLAPVGVGLWRNEPTGEIFTKLPYLDQSIPGQPRYLQGNEPNLETIIALKPDLILHHDYNDEANRKLYDSLAQIAPTLTYFGGTVGGWKRAITGLAQATGQTAPAETIIADYDARVAALQNEMLPVVKEAPDVTLLLSATDFVGVFDERFAIGGLMQTLGFHLTVPSSVEMDPSGFIAISAEVLGEIEANTIMQVRFDSDQAHISDPILASLPIPTLHTEIYAGMGYTGPFAEMIYLEGFASAFREQYLEEAAE